MEARANTTKGKGIKEGMAGKNTLGTIAKSTAALAAKGTVNLGEKGTYGSIEKGTTPSASKGTTGAASKASPQKAPVPDLTTRSKKPAQPTPIFGSGKAKLHVKKKQATTQFVPPPLASRTSAKAQVFKNHQSTGRNGEGSPTSKKKGKKAEEDAKEDEEDEEEDEENEEDVQEEEDEDEGDGEDDKPVEETASEDKNQPKKSALPLKVTKKTAAPSKTSRRPTDPLKVSLHGFAHHSKFRVYQFIINFECHN